MCGSFDTWHGACYAGLSQAEINARHKAFVSAWKHAARKRAFDQAMKMRRVDSRAATRVNVTNTSRDKERT